MTTPAATWRGFRFTPDDVLFFRDGRPSTRGADHYLPSLFPPYPSTLYGALRSRRLLDAGFPPARLRRQRHKAWDEFPNDVRDEIGPWGGYGTLRLRGPWLVRRGEGAEQGEILLPAPGDLAVSLRQRAGDSRNQPPRPEAVFRLRIVEPGDGGHSHSLGLLAPFSRSGDEWEPWPESKPPRPASDWFLTPVGMRRWAAGGVPVPEDLLHVTELWVDEPRVGVGIDAERRVSTKGELFTFGYIRLCPGVDLGFEVSGTALEPGRRVRLGGEGRTGWIDNGPGLDSLGLSGHRAHAVRLAFLTPMVSEGGPYPPAFDPATGEGVIGERRLSIEAACLAGHGTVGGWDLAKNAAKPLRRTVPAGSVFIVRPADGAPVEPSDLHGLHLAGYPDEHLGRQGFGLVVAGADPDSHREQTGEHQP